ncbi:MAG: MFS transporter, partial [Xanthomonadales bacterium]|nr:MFS transporter [Xanthomonadales bacterium]
IGAMSAMLWISSEALINELVEDHWRGRVIGIYAAAGAAGFALGPLLLIVTGSDGMLPFYATSTFILLAGLPLFVVGPQRMQRDEQQTSGLWAVFWLAPAIMLANVVYAAAAESLLTFFPLFGVALGISETFALGLMTAMGLGAMILVMPFSWLADRVDRMGMLAGFVLLTIAGLAVMPWAVQQPLLSGAFAFVFGGVEGMIYTLGVVLVGTRFRGALLAAATTLFTACWGVGTVIGPLLVGVGMDRFGAERMALVILLIFTVYLPLPVAAWLRGRRTRHPTEEAT